MSFSLRQRALSRAMQAAGVPALLLTHPPDVRYLCGFTGSNAALAIAGRARALFTDGRYSVQAAQQTQGARVHIVSGSAQKQAIGWLAARRQKSAGAAVAFDPEHTTVAELAAWKQALPAGLRRGFLRPLEEPLVAALRERKDAAELATMRQAAALGCRLFEHLLGRIGAGMPETAIAAELEYQARLAGAEGMAFETIVAAGARSALPHGQATTAPVARNGFIVLDFGVILRGYCSDMTRTVFLGRPNSRQREVYDCVLKAQQAAVAAVRPGVTAAEVDEAARGILRRAGLGEAFSHSTGHGVGMEIHEPPRLAARVETRLAPGMVITIEPGVYIAGEFGIRIEDMVAVTESGHEVLTAAAPKTLIELGPPGTGKA